MAERPSKRPRVEDTTTTMQIPTPLQPVMEGVKRVFQSKHYSDFRIVCGDHEWNVHKFWLCAQSDFFEKACGGEFKEAKENKIYLSDEDAHIVAAFVHYLYHFTYDAAAVTDLEPIRFDVRMSVFADKYFVESLKEAAVSQFEDRARTDWKEPAFAKAIAEIYQCTPAGKMTPLKSAMLNVVTEFAQDLLDPSERYKDFLEVLEYTGEFGKDVSMALARNARKSVNCFYRCPGCEVTFAVAADSSTFNCPCECCDVRTAGWWSRYKLNDDNPSGPVWHLQHH